MENYNKNIITFMIFHFRKSIITLLKIKIFYLFIKSEKLNFCYVIPEKRYLCNSENIPLFI